VITVSRSTSASPAAVWGVIADGWTYAAWVVGASRIRAVEGTWPGEGSRIHHSVGAWPVLLSDETVVVRSDPGHLLRLQARSRPLGEAFVEIAIEPEAGGGSRLEMREEATHGLARLIPQPVRQAAIAPRNAETLRRLALVAEARRTP
jgi:uncharacterized protein YndB with AHSA1/START domain